MPEPGPQIVGARERGALNDAQRRRLSVTCKYIDKLLCDIEQALHSAESTSPFARHVVDITPAQTRVIEDHISRSPLSIVARIGLATHEARSARDSGDSIGDDRPGICGHRN